MSESAISGPEYHGKECYIMVSNKETYASRESRAGSFMASDKIMVHGDTATFRVSFNIGDVPFGWFGKYEFLIREAAREVDSDRWLQDEVPLEAYYLSAPNLPAYFDKGIPLLLLRMFVLPARWQRSFKVEDWVKLVVKIVHGSSNPFCPTPCQTADHWLKYDSVHGSSSFSSAWGGQGLNLEAWLDAWRNWNQHKIFTHVNFYDQAAITEIALCLGMPHDQIHWEYHQVYGFIKDAELVGWGDCNNPYFEDDTNDMVYSNLENPDRQPFRNHAYLSWSKKAMTLAQYEEYDTIMKPLKEYKKYADAARKFEDDNGLKLFMIDACAGPHNDYAESIRTKNYERWEEQHHLGAGITTWNNRRCSNLLLDSEARRFEYERTKILQIMRADWMWARGGVMSGTLKQIEEPFFDVISKFQQGWENRHTLYVRPYRLEDGSAVHELKVTFAKGRGKDKSSGFVSMRVAVNKSTEAAFKQLASHLAFLTLTTRHRPMEAKNGRMAGPGSVYYIQAPRLRAFVYYNIAIDITSTEDKLFDVDPTGDSALWHRVLNKMCDMSVGQDMSTWEKFVQ